MDRISESNQSEGPNDDDQQDQDRTVPHGLSSLAQDLAAIQNWWSACKAAEDDASYWIGQTLNDLLGSPDERPDAKGKQILKLVVERMGIPRRTLNRYRRTASAFPVPEDDWG